MKKNILFNAITALALPILLIDFANAANIEESTILEYQVTAKKLDESRNKLSPKTGGSSFTFKQSDIENLPQGQATSLNQVLLRAPSVTQGTQGQLFVRGDHANLQYRINGVMLPEGITGFSQSLDTHFADKVDFLTGAMPAQYGFRTAGVVDITTKSGAFEKNNRSELMIGGNNTRQFNQQIGGIKGNLNYYLNATYLENNRGIESTTAARKSTHNDTNQNNLFGYFSYLIDASKRLNLIVSNSNNRFQIPNNPGQSANYSLNGYNNVDSNSLNQKQIESNKFVIAALQGVADNDVEYQLSLYSRYSDLKFRSDYVGDLVFNGIASDLDRSSFANGVQGDFSYELNEKNTLRSGFLLNNNRVKSATNNLVFATDDDGNQTSSDPFAIDEGSSKNSQFVGAYIQNEWKALDKLTVNYGVRLDASYAYVNESQVSPRLNTVYDLTKDTKIHAGYSRYFTPPPVSSISETTRNRFENTTNASESSRNDKVRAERTSYYDVGISHKVTPNLTLALDGYYKQIRNLLDEHQFGNSLIYSPFNYQQGKAYGLEFKADYRKDAFASYFNFSAQNAYGKNIISGQYIHDSEELEYISKNNVTLDHSQSYTMSGGISHSLFGTKYGADFIYGSGLRTGENNLNTMPSYIQFNANISRDVDIIALGKMNLRLALVNIFDKKYQLTDGSGIGVSASQYALRRTAYLIVSKKF
ncbi:MAG: TonB-dependent receptor [Rickettsiales bacterium]|nr:TonB-dependent receptor [Rickettsiales bacterium]